ncbi:MAG: GAF domain-containing protein [Ignavibacteria bacterium]|nr:GAF domain-containing protein [Ignavibacteria bacterium]
MTENLKIDKSLSDEEIYKQILPQIESLINPDEPLVSNLSNVTALLKDAFGKISWVGFYLFNRDKLFLGPFQGKVACSVIDLCRGVCGTSASKKETIIVDDVHKFQGHIACDSGSNSEIVIPIIKGNDILGVLDLDSYNYSAFNEVDKFYLERICKLLANKFSFKSILL